MNFSRVNPIWQSTWVENIRFIMVEILTVCSFSRVMLEYKYYFKMDELEVFQNFGDYKGSLFTLNNSKLLFRNVSIWAECLYGSLLSEMRF